VNSSDNEQQHISLPSLAEGQGEGPNYFVYKSIVSSMAWVQTGQ